jgi:hypothetical protein
MTTANTATPRQYSRSPTPTRTRENFEYLQELQYQHSITSVSMLEWLIYLPNSLIPVFAQRMGLSPEQMLAYCVVALNFLFVGFLIFLCLLVSYFKLIVGSKIIQLLYQLTNPILSQVYTSSLVKQSKRYIAAGLVAAILKIDGCGIRMHGLCTINLEPIIVLLVQIYHEQLSNLDADNERICSRITLLLQISHKELEAA